MPASEFTRKATTPKLKRQWANVYNSAKARGQDARHDALNYRHDQFDIEDGILSITLALTAVAALTETYWLLMVGWGFGAFGVLMGLAGIFEWPLHPEILTRWLG